MADDKDKIIKQLDKELDQLNAKLSSMASILERNMVKYLSDANTNVSELISGFEKGEDLTKVISKTSSEIAKILKKSNELSQVRVGLEASLSKAIQTNNFKEERKLRYKIQENDNTRDQLDLTNQVLRRLQTTIEEEIRITEEKKKQNSLLGASRKLGEEFIKPFKELFTVEGMLRLVVNSALNFNKISVDLGKNLAYGADGADRVASNFIKIARFSGNINVTTKNLAEAFNQISEATGFVAEYSANTLQTQIMLTKQFGLTGEEASKIYEYSVLTGKSSSQVNKNMVSAFVAARNQLGVGIPFKATIAEAAKVSGQLAANLKNNPEFIVKAVAQAKALGTTLEQTKAQGEALLNFESSIENELKAELLTGRAMNLERARAAALMGDQVTVAKELANQGMTLEKFQNMNVLAQQSFAAALGLSSDQLANQLRLQKLAIESGKSLTQITEEEALKAQERQSIQDRFNTSVEKLKDLFGSLLAGPLGGLLDVMTSILNKTWLLNGIVGGVLFYNIGKLIKAARLLKMEEIGVAISKAWAAAFSGPASIASSGLLGLAIGAGLTAAIISSVNSNSSMDDGVMGPNGKILYSKQEGAIKLNENDTVIAGTNLFNNPTNSKQEPTQINSDNSGVIAAINSLQETLKSKNFSPVMKADGIVMATVTAQNSYNLA